MHLVELPIALHLACPSSLVLLFPGCLDDSNFVLRESVFAHLGRSGKLASDSDFARLRAPH